MIELLVKQFSLDKMDVVNLLPFVLLEIRNYTNQYFLTTTNVNVSHIEDGKIYTDEDLSKFAVGDSLELLNSENNTLIYQIKSIGENWVEVEQEIVDEETRYVKIVKLSFKGVNLKTIQSMINYSIGFGSQDGIKSQTLGGYSVTFASPTGGDTIYPLELYGGINSLRKVNDDFAEYRRKGYVRL